MSDDVTAELAKARRLLTWATVLALVSVAVLGLDVMIKNAILQEAKDSQAWIDRLREDIRHGPRESPQERSRDTASRSPGDADMDDMADDPGAPQGTGPDVGVRFGAPPVA